MNSGHRIEKTAPAVVGAFVINFLALAVLLGSQHAVAQSVAPANQPAGAVASAADASAPSFSLSIDGTPISVKDFELLLGEKTAQGAKDTPELKAQVREELINRFVLAREAKRLGLDGGPDAAARLRLLDQQLRSLALFSQFASDSKPDEAQLQREYQRIVAELGTAEYRVRQIVVADEATALQILDQLKTGVSFAALATEHSLDKAARPRGGDMGWVTPSLLIKPLAAELSKLSAGQKLTPPVRTAAGWHLLFVEDRRPFTAPSFEAVRPNLVLRQQELAFEKKLEGLRAQAAIR